MIFIYHLTFLEVRSPAHVVQPDPLLRDSQGQNQGMGRAVLLTGPWREYMLPHSFRLFAESSSCICRTEVSFSLLVVWSLLLEASLWPLHVGSSSSEPQCYAESFSCLEFLSKHLLLFFFDSHQGKFFAWGSGY